MCIICYIIFLQIVFKHALTACIGTPVFSEGGWHSVFKDFHINISAELCGLSSRDMYLLGEKSFLGLIFTEQYHINFRSLRDATAWYICYRMSRVVSFKTIL